MLHHGYRGSTPAMGNDETSGRAPPICRWTSGRSRGGLSKVGGSLVLGRVIWLLHQLGFSIWQSELPRVGGSLALGRDA